MEEVKVKTCFKCQETLSLDEFYRHPEMSDGHVNKCKSCNKKDVSANYRDKADYYAEYDKKRNKDVMRRTYVALNYQKLVEENPEKYQAYKQKWAANNPDTVKAIHERNRRDFPEKFAARRKVIQAIRSGILKRLPCEVCGEEKSHAHHDDYSKPLEVIFLCPKHHMHRHRKYVLPCDNLEVLNSA